MRLPHEERKDSQLTRSLEYKDVGMGFLTVKLLAVILRFGSNGFGRGRGACF